LAVSPRPRRWIDETFLWATASLTIMAIAAAMTSAARWPSDPSRLLHVRSARPGAPAPLSHPVHAPMPAIGFAEPVPGYRVISPFGLRQLPWEEAGRLHKGVDIAAPMGAPVLAAADGTVVRAGVDAGYGRFIEIDHAGGMRSLYGHLSAFEARPGTAVRRGQAIGRIGSTGSSTGAHLHFEIHDPEGRALNPEMFLGRSFMRLADLPLRAAARLPRRAVRIAFVSVIPRAKEALMQAREEAYQDQHPVRPAIDVAAPMQPGVAPVAKATIAEAAPVLHVEGRGPDGRVHAVITPAD
jgi:hypothetical protein